MFIHSTYQLARYSEALLDFALTTCGRTWFGRVEEDTDDTVEAGSMVVLPGFPVDDDEPVPAGFYDLPAGRIGL